MRVWLAYYSSPFQHKQLIEVYGTLEKAMNWLRSSAQTRKGMTLDEKNRIARYDPEPNSVGVDYGYSYWIDEKHVL